MKVSPRGAITEACAVFVASIGFLFALAPSAPFTRELGVCESGAVRDVLAGNIILPYFIPGPMVHVPPLYWWTAALCVRAFGWNELALRLPSMMAAALTCAALFYWMATRIGRQAGFFASAALLCCHFVLDAARQPRMDSMLALFVTVAAIFLERAHNADVAVDSPSNEANGTPNGARFIPRRRIYLAFAALMIGLGILTKGILGIVLPGAVIGLYLIVRWRLRDLFRVDLIATFVVGLLIGLAWYFAAYEIGGRKFLDWQLTMNLWSRFVPAEAGGASYCAHPFWYFAPNIVTGFLPWSLYLPAIAVAAWPRRERKLSEPVVFAICWFAAIFLFFSASHGKCLVYILPAFPPLAALTGWAVSDALEGGPRQRLERLIGLASAAVAIGIVTIIVVAIGGVVFGLAAAVAPQLHPTDRRFVTIFADLLARRSPALMVWVIASIAGAIAIGAAIRRDDITTQVIAVVVIAASGTIFWFGAMNPILAQEETLEGFTKEVTRTVPSNMRIGHIGIEDCDLYFYSSRPIEPVFHFRCGANPPFPSYIVMRQRRFDEMNADERACLKPILQSPAVDSAGPRLLLEQVTPAH
jgi:hypothetical protein